MKKLPRNKITLTVFPLVLILLAGAPLFAGRGFQEELIRKDQKIIHDLNHWFDLKDKPVSLILHRFQADQTEISGLGFGLTRIEFTKYGGYTSCYINLLIFQDQISTLKYDCYNSGEYRRRVKKRLRSLWKFPLHRGPGFFNHTHRNEELFARQTRYLNSITGGFSLPGAKDRLNKSYRYLISPFNTITFGYSCFHDGGKPQGRQAMLDLLDRNKISLLQNVLRSPNPVGRLYALEALLILDKKGYALEATDREQIEMILESEIQISNCDDVNMDKDRTLGERAREIQFLLENEGLDIYMKRARNPIKAYEISPG